MAKNVKCNFDFLPVTDWKGVATDADGGTSWCHA